MPKLTPIELVEPTRTLNITGNQNDVAAWATATDLTMNGGLQVTMSKRAVKSNQTTRKSVLRITQPLHTTCESTCKTESRGTILVVCEVTASVQSTLAEREQAFEDLVQLLGDPVFKAAFVNNESFFS